MKTNIKIIRMQSGEDIVASYYHDLESNLSTLWEPMRLVLRRLETGKTVMMMLPWLPVEVMKENIATIPFKDILLVVDPKEEFVEYYDNTIIQIKSYIDEANMEELFEDDYLDEYDDQEEQYSEEEIDEIMEVKRKQPIH